MPRHSVILFTLAVAAAAGTASAQDGDALFDANCSMCHTIGGDSRDAPDLKHVTTRLERGWIIRFVLDPEGVTKSGDPYALALAKKYADTVMPNPEGLTTRDVEAILAYIEQRSLGGHPTTAPAEPQPAAMPAFTAPEIERGRALYAGAARFANRGPSCFSCHDIDARDGITGGTLGPALSGALDRLNGVKGLSLWLAAPPTPIMRSVYRHAPLAPEEIRALAAFMDARAKEGAAPQRPQRAALPLAGGGVALALLGFVAMGAAWRGRFRAVRRPLVDRMRRAPRVPSTAPITRQGFRSGGPR